MNRRLYRSRTDSILGGVAGGVAEYLDVDPSIVRIVWAVLAIVTGGIFFVLYIVMWIVVPEETPGPYVPGPGAQPGWVPPSGEAPVPPAAAPAVEPQQPVSEPATAVAREAAAGEAAAVEAAGAPAGDAAPASPVPPGAAPPPPAPAAWTPPGHDRHRRRGNAGLIFGVILVALGVWFLIDEYVPAFRTDLFWPIGLVLLGVILLVVSMRRPSGG